MNVNRVVKQTRNLGQLDNIMPLHRIYSTPGTFSVEDKAAIAERITAFYTAPPTNLPAFYVNVLFIDVPKGHYLDN